MSINWKTETRQIKELHENPKNPRKMAKIRSDQLEKSLDKFGQCDPVIITKNNQIIGGHQRIRTLKKMGVKNVSVSVPDRELSEKEVDELTIILNKVMGSWDADQLANCWDPSDLIQWGFTQEELHLESIPDSEEPPKNISLNIKMRDEEQLRMIEKHVETILSDFPGSSYKVKVK